MNKENSVVRCFMDGIDWEEHLGFDANGTRLYPSERALIASQPHIIEGGCGIVEVEVRLIRWVKPQNLKYESVA